MKTIEIIKIIFSIFICQFAGIIGSIFTADSIQTWYLTLNKPYFAPPNWVFAPVWITLYFLMGVSVYLIWREGSTISRVKTALTIFSLQLILNAIWSPVFFGLRSPIAGFVVIDILWIAILLTIVRFYKISKIAGLLLVPYIVWVSIASILNFSILILNP